MVIIGKVKFQSSFVHEKQSSGDIDNTRGMNQCLLPLRRDALVLLYQSDDKVDVCLKQHENQSADSFEFHQNQFIQLYC